MLDPHPIDSPLTVPPESGNEPEKQPSQSETEVFSAEDPSGMPPANRLEASQLPEDPRDKSPDNDLPTEAQPQSDSDEATLDLYVRDAHGDPIPNLEFIVLDRGPSRQPRSTPPAPREVFKGKTDATGRAPLITGLKLGTRFEIRVKKDDGNYKLAAIGPMDAQEMMACLKSPRVRFEFNTVSHRGSAGTADKKKQEIIKRHNQVPESTPNISRNPEIKPSIQEARDKDGNPKAFINDGLPNMYGQHANRANAPNSGTADIDKVRALIEFGMKQINWKHRDATSADIIHKMKSGVYQVSGTKDPSKSVKRCTRYVKIALWKAGFSHNDGDIDPLVSPARDMGPALEKAGFRNITKQLPDARWASPGDVIVYVRSKEPQADGHIDIRTYDGYLSDFFGSFLPVRSFSVIGIYRKYYDPEPELRMRAFLRAIQSRETKDIPDHKAWYALNTPIAGKKFASGLSTHPWLNEPLPESIKANKSSTAAGAYQIILSGWKECIEKFKSPNDFTPTTQQIIAVIKCEQRGALPLIRTGDIPTAISKLRHEWTSLPGASQSHDSLDKFVMDYERFLADIKRGTHS